MLHDQAFAFIGSGTMAEAMIKGLITSAGVPAPNIFASGPRLERGHELRTKYGVQGTTHNLEAITGAQIVVLSVKPQMLHGVMEELAGRIAPEALVLSIVAGARIETITAVLRHNSIARAMPNTPAQIGLGMTVWTCPEALNQLHRHQAQAVFGSFGEEVYVSDERYLDMATALSGTKIVVLSVKPQVLHDVLEQLAGHIAPEALVLSIVAGARTEVITNLLLHKAVVRSMPNTPAQIGLGMTVWTCPESMTQMHRDQAKAVFSSIGEEVFVSDERYLDMATALSGTGPAYVFLFMEAMVDAGVHMGFSRNVAEQLVYQTVRGSVEYARQAGRHLATLRNQVTSPGGTSAEALYQIEKGGLRTVMSRAIWAAYQKSRRLGRGVEED